MLILSNPPPQLTRIIVGDIEPLPEGMLFSADTAQQLPSTRPKQNIGMAKNLNPGANLNVGR